MRRLLLLALVIPFVVACDSDKGETTADSPVLVVGLKDLSPREYEEAVYRTDLGAAIEAYTNSMLRGDDEAAWEQVSARCQSVMDRTAFNAATLEVSQRYGPHTDSLAAFTPEIDGDEASVDYELSDNPELSQQHQSWVHDGTAWRLDNC